MLVLLNVPGFALSFKLRPSWWCWWAFSSEAGFTSLQVGGLVLEFDH